MESILSECTIHNDSEDGSWQEVQAATDEDPAPVEHSTQAGPHLPPGVSDVPTDYFRLLLDDNFFDLILRETNRYKENIAIYTQ